MGIEPRFDSYKVVSEQFGFLHDGVDGPAVGFKILDYSEFDADDPEVSDIWGQPHFDAPQLGLTDVSAGEIVVAARTFFAGTSSVNRYYFSAAIEEQDRSPEQALALWLCCLEAGDSMAHFAVGYTLYELGRYHEAYRHLRHYTEIAPFGAWNWCWYGKAAEAIGEVDEAHAAYERALELSVGGDQETDAGELLDALDARAA